MNDNVENIEYRCRRLTRAINSRHGISLLEVLFSMGILLLGLLGVGAMLAGGRFEVLQGSKQDQATMVGRAAFRDLRVRGFLNPWNWFDVSNTAVFNYPNLSAIPPYPTYWFSTSNPVSTNRLSPLQATTAVAIDPIGLAAGYGGVFPVPATAAQMTRIYPSAQVTTLALADPIFRSAADLVLATNTAATGKDALPIQQMLGSNKRGSTGSYSWIATLASTPSVGSNANTDLLTLSVAVFFKRDTSAAGNGEFVAGVNSISGATGTELQLANLSKALLPSQWIMLAGNPTINVLDSAGNPLVPPVTFTAQYFRWYRVVSADVLQGNTQYVTLAGPDWSVPQANTQAWIFDNIVAVYEKNVRLEIQ